MMLPFFAAGGAISGANFGVFYTVLMQLGYNYFGKIALKRISQGDNLFDILMDIQKEIQPFNESMMQIALDLMPSTIGKTADLLEEMINQGVINAGSNLSSGLGLEELFKYIRGTPEENIPDYLKAEARRGSKQFSKGGFIGPVQPDSVLANKERKIRLDKLRVKQDMIDAAKRVKERGPLRTDLVPEHQKQFRKAGQSQKMERIKLMKEISEIGRKLRIDKSQSAATRLSRERLLRKAQQSLVNLQLRYKF